MFVSIVAVAKSAITTRAGTAANSIKRILRPTTAVTAVTAATIRDATRPRSELIAENALLR